MIDGAAELARITAGKKTAPAHHYQDLGLRIAKYLGEPHLNSRYIKLCKDNPDMSWTYLAWAKEIAEKPNARNKAAVFTRKVYPNK
jgi:hypothetical protein